MAKPICEPGRFVCVEGCTSDAQCSGSTPVCNVAKAGCVECGANTDCASQSGKFCDPDGACVACLVGNQCPTATPICSNEACVQCATVADCPSGALFCLNGTCGG
jgi:Cys-rich repeat protein